MEDDFEGRLWPERFHIHDEASADWAVDKLVSMDEKLERLERQYKAAKAAIMRDKEAFERRFLSEIRAWAEGQLTGKTKTLHLLSGSISFRSVKGGPRIKDHSDVLAWAQENLPEAVVPTVTLKVDAQAVKDHVKAWGEIPPGVEIVDDRQELYIKPVKE
jgi:phage host-nuclease inhibitor protein Gam